MIHHSLRRIKRSSDFRPSGIDTQVEIEVVAMGSKTVDLIAAIAVSRRRELNIDSIERCFRNCCATLRHCQPSELLAELSESLDYFED